jgi:hypothetical protein
MFHHHVMMWETILMDSPFDIPCWFYHNKEVEEGKCPLSIQHMCGHCESFTLDWIFEDCRM